MFTLVQQSPPPSDEFGSSTHNSVVLQNASQSTIPNATQNVIQDTVQDSDHTILFGEQASQHFTLYCSSNDLDQAFSCLHAGIGVELWCLERIWPGICKDLWWFDCLYPNILSSAISAAILAMMFGPSSNKRKFDCPVFVAEARNGWPRTCNNVKSTNMADLRRHLTTRPGRGYTPQLSFLELCPTCNDDFLDREVFESQHGYRGEFCNNRQPQRRGSNAQVQWELLYRQVEESMSSQRISTQQDESNSALSGPSASPPAPSVTGNDSVGSPADQLVLHNQEAMPYLTPYQLIVDSDSDQGEPEAAHEHTVSPISSGLKQPASHAWPESRHAPLDLFEQNSLTPINIMGGSISTGRRDSGEMREYFEPGFYNACPVVSFNTPQHNGTGNVTSFTGPRSQGEDRRPARRPEYPHQPRTPGYPQPRPRTPSNMRIQHGHANQAARLSDSQSSSTTSRSSDPLYCLDCDAFFTGKYRKGNLARHRRHNHKRGAQSYICEVEDCGRLYARGDALLKHFRKHHPELDIPEVTPRDSSQSNASASFEIDQHSLIGLMSPYEL